MNINKKRWDVIYSMAYALKIQVSMVEMKVTKTSPNIQRKERDEASRRLGPALPKFLTQFHEKLQNSVKTHLNRSAKFCGSKTGGSFFGKDRRYSTALDEVNLEKQLQAWKENPSWDDQSPNIEVTVPKGSLCNLSVELDVGLPPDAVYNIVTDPDNKRVFKNIQEVKSRRILVDEGSRQVVEVEQAASWKFLWWSGTIAVHVLVDQNRDDYSMRFKQVKTGFMERFEGCWTLEPLFVDERSCHPFVPKTLGDYVTCTRGKGRVGSKVRLQQLIQPSVVPPPPISWYLRGITSKTTEMMLTDLMAEAARIREDPGSKNCVEEEMGISEAALDDECDFDQVHDIKQRWALRRKNRRQIRRILP